MENRDKQLLIDKLKSIVKSFVKVVKDKTYKDLDGIIEQLKELANQVLPPLKGFIRRNPSKPKTGEQGKFTSAQVPLKKTIRPPVNKAFKQEAIKERLEKYKTAKKVGYNSEKGSGNPALNEIFNNRAIRKPVEKTVVPVSKRRVISSTRPAGYPGNNKVNTRIKERQELIHDHALKPGYVKRLTKKINKAIEEHRTKNKRFLLKEYEQIIRDSLRTRNSKTASNEERAQAQEVIKQNKYHVLNTTGAVTLENLNTGEKTNVQGVKIKKPEIPV